MSKQVEDARVALFQVSHGAFVAERKRLAAELKAHDKTAAAQLAKEPRPSVAAWAVNQLWWKARDDFEALMTAAKRVRDGELAAMAVHREVVQRLILRAGELLREDDNAAADATLRKVEFTLLNVAMKGFEPDAPGMLASEREPPGFDSLSAFPTAPPPVLKLVPPLPKEPDEAALARVAAEEAALRLAREKAHEDAEREVASAHDDVARAEALLQLARVRLDKAEQRHAVTKKALE